MPTLPQSTNMVLTRRQTTPTPPAVPTLPVAQPTATFSGFRVSQQLLESTAALQAGISGITEANATTTTAVLVYQLMVDADEDAITQQNGEIYVSRMGVGVELSVRLFDTALDFTLNLTTIALACQANLARSELNIKLRGLEDIRDQLGALPAIGVLHEEGGLEQVLSFLRAVKDALASRTQLTPARYTLLFGQKDLSALEEAQSTAFAMHQIAAGAPLQVALQQGARLHDPDTIRHAYALHLDTHAPHTIPTDAQRQQARRWLDLP